MKYRACCRPPVLLIICLLISACATPTPYRPLENGTGYSDRQVEKNRYLVSFVGNSLTPRQQVEEYLLYRAAEITLASGNDYFLVERMDVERRTENQMGADYVTTAAPFYHYGYYPAPTYYRYENYGAFASILVYSGAKPAGQTNAYDAHQLIRYLAPAPPPSAAEN